MYRVFKWPLLYSKGALPSFAGWLCRGSRNRYKICRVSSSSNLHIPSRCVAAVDFLCLRPDLRRTKNPPLWLSSLVAAVNVLALSVQVVLKTNDWRAREEKSAGNICWEIPVFLSDLLRHNINSIITTAKKGLLSDGIYFLLSQTQWMKIIMCNCLESS